MSTIIKIKYSSGTAQPADDLLSISELAYSFNSQKLFVGSDDGSGGTTPIVIGGKVYMDKLDHAHGTLTADSAILVDSNKKINELFVDNLSLDGNTITTTDTNGNLNIAANGTGSFDIARLTNITGGLVASTLQVSDLTANRAMLIGASGELTDSAQFTYSQGSGVIDVNIEGSLDVDNITFDGSDISTTNTNGNLTLTPNGSGLVVVDKTTGLKIASGVVGTRPSAATVGDAVIRYNETTNRFEGTVSGAWTGLGGVVDVDQDTYITAEENADEDKLRFYTGGTQRAVIDSTGLLLSGGTTLNTDKLIVDDITLDDDIIDINGSTIQGTGNSSSGTLILDPAPAAGDSGGELIVRGNLSVTGTTTTVNSTVVEIADPIMVLGEDSATDSLDRGLSFKYLDGTAKTAFAGWDRSSYDAFTFIKDGSIANARFNGLHLADKITHYAGATLTDGQLLIGNTATGKFDAATLTEGDSLTITHGNGSIELDVDAASAHATSDIHDTGDGVVDYSPATSNVGSRGAASFSTEQFTVTQGHVVIKEMDGGTF